MLMTRFHQFLEREREENRDDGGPIWAFQNDSRIIIQTQPLIYVGSTHTIIYGPHMHVRNCVNYCVRIVVHCGS